MRIIHITDLHFWEVVRNPLLLMNKRILGNLNLLLRRRRYVKQERARSFAELLGTLQADAVLVGGDLTTTATDAEYRMAAAFLDTPPLADLPVYITAGNHDRYTFESCRHRRFEHYFGERLANPDMPALTTLPDGRPLLIVPTARPNLLSSRGFISPQQLAATAALLDQTREETLVVLAHYPLLPHPAYHSDPMRRLGNANKLRVLLGRSEKQICYLAGHVHAFSHQRDPQYPNLEHITSRALFYDKHLCPGGFTELIFEGKIPAVIPWEYRNGWERLDPSTAPQR